MNFEGIIIHKAEHKERDLICKLLLRSGKTLSFYFYGGRGGGKKNKGSFLELGHMVRVTTKPGSRKNLSEIQIANEYNLIWDSQNIRKDHFAFYLLCFVSELLQKISVQEDIDHLDSKEFEGIFKVVSNLLFYVDLNIKQKEFDIRKSLFVFFAKILNELGSLPNLKSCGTCAVSLDNVDMARFEPQDGHFLCYECLQAKGESLSGNLIYIDELKTAIKLKKDMSSYLENSIKDFNSLNNISFQENESLFNYLCYQFGFNANNFKTWDLIKAI